MGVGRHSDRPDRHVRRDYPIGARVRFFVRDGHHAVCIGAGTVMGPAVPDPRSEGRWLPVAVDQADPDDARLRGIDTDTTGGGRLRDTTTDGPTQHGPVWVAHTDVVALAPPPHDHTGPPPARHD